MTINISRECYFKSTVILAMAQLGNIPTKISSVIFIRDFARHFYTRIKY